MQDSDIQLFNCRMGAKMCCVFFAKTLLFLQNTALAPTRKIWFLSGFWDVFLDFCPDFWIIIISIHTTWKYFGIYIAVDQKRPDGATATSPRQRLGERACKEDALKVQLKCKANQESSESRVKFT